jgi:release factor glutamine methyltransferase
MILVKDWVAQQAASKDHNIRDHRLLWKIASAAIKQPVPIIWDQYVSLSDLTFGLTRYLSGEPITRIQGAVTFCDFLFITSPAVLDPRPETEMIVEIAVKLKPRSVLDLGTGSGCIICSISKLVNLDYALGIDISYDALEIAKINAARLNAKCEFRISDWCGQVHENFDLIVSNPPYVGSRELLPLDVWAYDPNLSLDGGIDGCDVHRAALPQAIGRLNPSGVILWEIGSDQSEWILEYAQNIAPNAKNIEILRDYNHLPRVLRIDLH